MMSSSVTATWPTQLPYANAVATRAAIRTALVETFTGPPEKGAYSPGVQHTLHKMGLAALDAALAIPQITLNLPNIHYLPAKNLDAMEGDHLKFEDDVFIPVDEPHGTIEATLKRNIKAKL